MIISNLPLRNTISINIHIWLIENSWKMALLQRKIWYSKYGLMDFFTNLFFFYYSIRYFLHLHFKYYPLYTLTTLFPNPPTPSSKPWHSPLLGHVIFTRPKASHPNDGGVSHHLLHMQLNTWALWELDGSYCCSSYRVAYPICSLGTFSSSFIGGSVLHTIDDTEHPLLD